MKNDIVFAWSILSIVHQQVTKWEKTKTFEYAERAPGVRMIIVDEAWKICVTKEWRHELNTGQWWYDFRLPGGKVVDSLEEYSILKEKWKEALFLAAKEAVKIEAGEEVWILPENIEFLRISPCGATMRWDLYYFVVDAFSIKESGQDLWWSEDIVVWRYSPDEVKHMCLSGQVSEDRSVAVLLQWLHEKNTMMS